MEHQIRMLQEITDGLNSERFLVIDDTQINDTQSGLIFNMPDAPEPFYITVLETGEEVAHMRDYMDKPDLLKMFMLLKEKLISVYEGIAEAKRNNLVEIFNTIPTEPIE